MNIIYIFQAIFKKLTIRIMGNKKVAVRVKPQEKSEVEKALEVIQSEQQKKSESFLSEYKLLCLKHGLELTVNPQINWEVAPIKK